MDEESLYGLRRTPPEEFVRRLRASLQSQQTQVALRQKKAGKLIALAACCAVVFAVFTVPAVRAAAQAFLDMFRVVNFVGVSVTPEAMQRLRNTGVDLPHLLGDEVHVLQKAGPPTPYPTPQEAGAVAGFHVRLPTWMPVGWDTQPPGVEILGETSFRVTIDTAKLQQVLGALGIDDETLPQNINGQSATIHTSSAVVVQWKHDDRTVELLQAPSPQAQFPAGIDLAALGEIGLRILGTPREDAYRLAQSIDWRTTLLLPVPPNAGRFSQVTVQGNPGLLISMMGKGGPRRYGGAMVLWSNNGQVFALRGTLQAPDLVEIAQTLQ